MGLLISEIEMKHIAAYALLVLGGKAEPSAKDIEKVLKGAGADKDDEKIKALCEALKGKSFHELVAAGTAKLGSMGTAAAASAPAAWVLIALRDIVARCQSSGILPLSS